MTTLSVYLSLCLSVSLVSGHLVSCPATYTEKIDKTRKKKRGWAAVATGLAENEKKTCKKENRVDY